MTYQLEQIPASYAQSRLWILDSLIADKAVYNVSMAYEIEGPLNPEALTFAFKKLIQRHEILRTYFQEQHGAVYQVISPDLHFEIEYKKTDDIPAFLKEESQIPFALDLLPLFRVCLVQQVMCITMHHIITDGWSFSIFCKEISFYYNAFLQQNFAELPELQFQYADFSLWQQEWLKEKVMDRQLEFWKKTLQGAPDTLDIVTDRPRPKRMTHAGAVYSFAFPVPLTSAIKQLAQEMKVTHFTFLLTLFQILLFRLTHQKDFVLGTPVANRHYPGIEDVIGFFVNTIAIRSQIEEESSFLDMLRLGNERMIQALDHQDIPFEKVVGHLDKTRQQNRHPLFQVMFVLQNAGSGDLELDHLKMTPIPLPSHGAKFDLLVSAQEKKGMFSIDMEYALDLFDPSTMEQIAACYQTLAAQIVQNPAIKIRELFLVSPARQSICQGPKAMPSPFQNINQAFQSVVQRIPDGIALSCDTSSMTYSELNERSNQLAQKLRQYPLSKKRRIAVCVNQNADSAISFIAILKIGGCYVPIDPSTPPQRIKQILAETGPDLILTSSDHAPFLKAMSPLAICSTEIEDSPLLPNAFEANDDAYIVYTSGSTGTPKGAVVSHKNFLHSTFARQHHYGQNIRSVLLMHSISFDVAIASMGWALLSGAELVLPGKRGHKEIDHLLHLISERKVSHFLCQPTLYQLLLEIGENQSFSSLRGIALGGERWPDHLAELHKSKIPNASLYNEYGPTEATVWSSCQEIYNAQTGKDFPITIGRPIVNTAIYILDKYHHPMPIKMVGEICIAGDGVSSGYFNDSSLTKEKFIRINGEKIYRTGDLGRYLENGEIELWGRLDKQIKIRGYRVEPGEIESVLTALDIVSQAIVVPIDGELAAYIVPSKPIIQTLEKKILDQIAAHLENYLPDYMVPTYFILIDKIPLTLNDKVDTNALPKPFFYASSPENLSPKNELETFLYAIWKEVLGREQFSITDNFFRIGGNSLLAIQAVLKIKEKAPQLSIQLFFENPTIEKLSAVLEKSVFLEAKGTDFRRIKKRTGDAPIPLSYAQERYWRKEIASKNALYNMPLALRLAGSLNLNTLEESLAFLIERHPSFRTVIKIENQVPTQCILQNVEEWFHTQDLSHLDEGDRQNIILRLIKEETEKKFDLERGPLIRIHLIKEHNDSHTLLIMQHHVISDGLSMELFLKELCHVYKGEKGNLPPLKLHYSDYCFWQRDFLQGKGLQEQLSYWKEQLKNPPSLIHLPFDRARPPIPSLEGNNYYLSQEIHPELLDLCASAGVSLFAMLLAIFNILMFAAAKQKDFVIGTVVAKRDQKELQDMIGLLINLVPLRFRINPTMTFLDLLRQVKEVSLEAYINSDVPYDILLKELKIPLNCPLFNVIFKLQETFGRGIELQNVKFELIPFEYHLAKYDLTVDICQNLNDLNLRFEYAADLFDRATIQNLCWKYKRLLNTCVQFPNKSIAELTRLVEV